jgi:opacity protein-like surface antigen
MKTLILASAAVLSLGIGSAFAATVDTAQPSQQQVALNAQANGTQSGSFYGAQANRHPSNGYVGGYQRVPSSSMWGGD